MRDVPESPRRRGYLESITSLVSSLGPQVVVEGVERLEQIAPLMEQGVPLMQGYLFARPAPANDVRANIIEAGEVIARWTDQSATPFQPGFDWTGEIGRDDLLPADEPGSVAD
jgi:EAL domain-containing protein (putative c-di-GMP-specific phosphodiesterase class I)